MNPFIAIKNLSAFHFNIFTYPINPSLHFTSLFIFTAHFPSLFIAFTSSHWANLARREEARWTNQNKTFWHYLKWKNPRRPHIKNRDIRAFFISIITDCHPAIRPIPPAASSQGVCGYIAVMATLKFTCCFITFVIPFVFINFINKLDWSVCTCLTQLYLIVEICIEFSKFYTYEGESKIKGKIHLTALIEVTVSNFTYHFST